MTIAPPKQYLASSHALQRLDERFPGRSFHDELAAAFPWGVNNGTGQLFLAPCGAVFVTERHKQGVIVKTVLTEEQAKANASMRYGVDFTSRSDPDTTSSSGTLDETSREQIIEIAQRHARLSKAGQISKRNRMQSFENSGFIWNSEAGDLYREQFGIAYGP